jgi:hypothetical protein
MCFQGLPRSPNRSSRRVARRSGAHWRARSRSHRSNTRGWSSAGMPIPRSHTDRSAQLATAVSSRRRVTVMFPPSGLYLMAFPSRLSNTRSRRTTELSAERDLGCLEPQVVPLGCLLLLRYRTPGQVDKIGGARCSVSGCPISIRGKSSSSSICWLILVAVASMVARPRVRRSRFGPSVRAARRQRSWDIPLMQASGAFRSCAVAALIPGAERLASLLVQTSIVLRGHPQCGHGCRRQAS